LPKGWRRAQLGDICTDIRYGLTAKANAVAVGPIFLRITDIENSGKVSFEKSVYAKATADEIKRYRLEKGDIVIARSGSLGKVHLFRSNNNVVFASYLIRFRPDPMFVLPEFLDNYLHSHEFYEFVEKEKTIAAQPNINAQKLKRLSVPLPPLEEQKRIVSRIEELTARIDKARRLRAAANQKTATLMPAALAEVFERAEKEKWKKVALCDVVNNYDHKRIPLKKADRAKMQGKYPYYGASGIIDYVDDFIFDGEYLLVSEDGANLRARVTPIAFVVSGQFWVNNHAHIVQTTELTTNSYLSYVFAATDISRYVSGSAQPKLNQANLNRIEIPLPPLHQQYKVVAQLDAVQEQVTDLKRIQAASQAELESLTQSILAKAFQGEL